MSLLSFCDGEVVYTGFLLKWVPVMGRVVYTGLPISPPHPLFSSGCPTPPPPSYMPPPPSSLLPGPHPPSFSGDIPLSSSSLALGAPSWPSPDSPSLYLTAAASKAALRSKFHPLSPCPRQYPPPSRLSVSSGPQEGASREEKSSQHQFEEI